MSMDGLRQGGVARLWPVFDSVDGPDEFAGHVSLDQGKFRVEVLGAPGSTFSLRPVQPFPRAMLLGSSTTSAVLMLPTRRQWSERPGPRPSTVDWWFDAAFAPVPLSDLESIGVRSLTAHFSGLAAWTGMTTSHEKYESDHEGRLTAWSVELKATESRQTKLARGRQLKLSGHWQVNGPQHHREIYAPAAITLSSSKPAKIEDLLVPLLQVQDLLGLAFDAFMPASSGEGILDARPQHRLAANKSEFWSRQLMYLAPGVAVADALDLPYFDLDQCGGWEGVRRWLALCDRFPRAVSPLVDRFRYGDSSPHVRVLDMCAAIEYWVKGHREKGLVWAQRDPSNKHGGSALLLARHVGAPFTEWVGDPRTWAEALWTSYNNLKHVVEYQADDQDLSDLAASARLLLAAELLNRTARSKEPSRAIFASTHRHWRVRDRIRRLTDGNSS